MMQPVDSRRRAPLDAPEHAHELLPTSLDIARPVDGVLISHPHMDHYGEMSAAVLELSSGLIVI